MPITTTIDADGQSHIEITWDQAGYERWKAAAATWRRYRFATDATYRAVSAEGTTQVRREACSSTESSDI